MTMLARIVDGLPLAASVGDDAEMDQNLVKYTNQAKMLFRKLSPQSPRQCSLESGPYLFHYLIEQGVCYLCLCDRSFPKKNAFAYLEDLRNEFTSQYGKRGDTVTRPYHFIEFDQYLQTAKRRYVDGRGGGGSLAGRQQLGNINTELQDVQKIMVQNIEDVIHRGEALTILDDKATHLSALSKKYKEDARYLNLRSTYTKIALVVILIGAFLLMIRFWWR